MKTLILVLLMLLPAAAAAQEVAAAPDESHGVAVVKARWHKQLYIPALEEDPMLASIETAEMQRERKETMRANSTRGQLGREPLPVPTQPRGTVGKADRGPASTFYVYEVTVSNNGKKKIRSLTWEYVLFEAETAREVGRHLFETRVGIGVGKSKGLTGWSTQPPAAVVHVSKSDREASGQFSERIDVQRVVYEDGTVWERARKE
jgi:hypothetical protein